MNRRRPVMADYGTEPTDAGMLTWEWAVDRLTTSRDYWVATVHPGNRPNMTPVWGVWLDDAVWFSCGPRSRKARNLGANPEMAVSTDDAEAFVVVEGTAERRTDVQDFTAASLAKYGGDLTEEFYAANALFRVRPRKIIALTEEDFSGSPTCWDVG